MSEHYVPVADAFSDGPRFPKICRENTALISVEAELCPQVMMRVLGSLTSRGILPFTISVRCDDRSQLIEIELAKPSQSMLPLVHNGLRRIVNVRRVQVTASNERPAPGPPGS